MLLILKSKKRNYAKMKLFLKELRDKLIEKNCQFTFSSFEEVEVFLEKGQAKILVAGKPLETWSTIYPRKVGSHRGIAFIMARLSKYKKINFIDKYHEQSKDSSDAAKIIQMFRLGVAGVSIPKTYYTATYSNSQIKNAVKYLHLPIVAKECNTSQGSGVFLAKSIPALKKIIRERLLKDEKKEIFLQEFIPNKFEYRILITGKKVAVVEKKIRNDKEEFRNNVHLGAREEFINISAVKKELLKEALLASKITDIQVAGVDIVERENGRPAIFEVNSCPAFTMDAKASNEIKKLADYLSKCEKR